MHRLTKDAFDPRQSKRTQSEAGEGLASGKRDQSELKRTILAQSRRNPEIPRSRSPLRCSLEFGSGARWIALFRSKILRARTHPLRRLI
jgi:hypothetical protein